MLGAPQSPATPKKTAGFGYTRISAKARKSFNSEGNFDKILELVIHLIAFAQSFGILKNQGFGGINHRTPGETDYCLIR
jgi:hypothetical protein